MFTKTRVDLPLHIEANFQTTIIKKSEISKKVKKTTNK